MSVDAAAIRRIARLARIAVSEDEIPHLQGEVNHGYDHSDSSDDLADRTDSFPVHAGSEKLHTSMAVGRGFYCRRRFWEAFNGGQSCRLRGGRHLAWS